MVSYVPGFSQRNCDRRVPVFRNLVLSVNKALTGLRDLRVPAKNLLLLVPHCLQRSGCGRNIIHDLDQCEHCGQCTISALLKLRDEFGVQCSLVSGGREATTCVKKPDVKVVVAVACEKELADGVFSAFPKPVVTIPNLRPHGPCKDTQVDIERVKATLESLVLSPES
jgi:hypothetical protein